MSENDIEKREKPLRIAIERLLPDFVKSCREQIDELLLIHQDAFEVEYNEYELLGMAIRFAGLYGKEVRIIGKNRETLGAAATSDDVEEPAQSFRPLLQARYQLGCAMNLGLPSVLQSANGSLFMLPIATQRRQETEASPPCH
jgi:hypothetical protein